MGNYHCKKCGVPADYYTESNIDRHSCRVWSKQDLRFPQRGNCRHDFKYFFWCNSC